MHAICSAKNLAWTDKLCKWLLFLHDRSVCLQKTKNCTNIIDPNIPSSLAPICQSDILPIPILPIDKESDSSPESTSTDENYEPEEVFNC